jgi:hypothetical protein
MNISGRGVRNTYGIPGTGLSYQGKTTKWSSDGSANSGCGCGTLLLLALIWFIWSGFNHSSDSSTDKNAGDPQFKPVPAQYSSQFTHPTATPYDEAWQPSPSPTPDRLAESHTDAETAPTAAPVAPAKHTKRHRN